MHLLPDFIFHYVKKWNLCKVFVCLQAILTHCKDEGLSTSSLLKTQQKQGESLMDSVWAFVWRKCGQKLGKLNSRGVCSCCCMLHCQQQKMITPNLRSWQKIKKLKKKGLILMKARHFFSNFVAMSVLWDHCAFTKLTTCSV